MTNEEAISIYVSARLQPMMAVVKKNVEFHVVTVGWSIPLIEGLWRRVEEKSENRFSHIVHPSNTPQEWPDSAYRQNIHFFRDGWQQAMPAPDCQLLASLEQDGVPTVHNMIMADRIVSKLPYDDAISYATFLATRLKALFSSVKPSVIIGGFDAVHSSIALAVAKYMNIPWFALNFSVIPPGMACFCDRMCPAARAFPGSSSEELKSFAEKSLEQFEKKTLVAPAYIAPDPLSIARRIAKLPQRFLAAQRTIRQSRFRQYLQFTEARTALSVKAALLHLRRTARARKAISKVQTLTEPPLTPYVFFGLHFQPESSIDVWAPFFSNQTWVIELLSRSIPPTHKLLVKIHKSDVSNYSREQLERMRSFPGVELVAPFADTRSFIENSTLTIGIQGTIGLEAALLGKPVIMLGESPVSVFPNVSPIGEIIDLPKLIRRKFVEAVPIRSDIISAYASYLAPFLPASHNVWTEEKTDDEIDRYVELFRELRTRMTTTSAPSF